MILHSEIDNITAHINTQGTHKQRQGYYYSILTVTTEADLINTCTDPLVDA